MDVIRESTSPGAENEHIAELSMVVKDSVDLFQRRFVFFFTP